MPKFNVEPKEETDEPVAKKARGGAMPLIRPKGLPIEEIARVSKTKDAPAPMGFPPTRMKKGGGIEGKGFKSGGAAEWENTKVVGAKQAKGFDTKSGGVEGKGYRKGGGVSEYVNTKVDEKMRAVPKKTTGEIRENVAGYAEGGHVKMSVDGCGHSSMHGKGDSHGHARMKKGGRC